MTEVINSISDFDKYLKKTKNLNEVCKEADILIAAAGKPNLVDSSFVKEGAVIIDVGIHRLKSSDKNKTRLLSLIHI